MSPINADAKESPTQPVTQTMVGAIFLNGLWLPIKPAITTSAKSAIPATRTTKTIDLPTIPPLGSASRNRRSPERRAGKRAATKRNENATVAPAPRR